MESIIYLVPIALVLGAGGVAIFLWALRTGQYDDLDGAPYRILYDDGPHPETAQVRKARQKQQENLEDQSRPNAET